MIKRVYKFGGASVKDADAVRNLKNIIEKEDRSDLMLVISNSKGYGGPMANEGTFDDVEATLPKSKDIWE